METYLKKKKKIEIEFRLVFSFTCFLLSSKLNFDLYFELCQIDEIIQIGSTSTYMMTSGMHRRPFEGRHLVFDF